MREKKEELHLSGHDIALNSELGSKINAIKESINSTYLNISQQSQIASQKIAEMSLIKS